MLLNPLYSFDAMLRDALGDELAPEASEFVSMMAPDGEMEFPYSPPGALKILKGREAIAAHLARLGEILHFDGLTRAAVHKSDSPGVFILQFQGRGRGRHSGEPYNQDYISVVTVRAGHIVRYIDYWNPLVVLQALGPVESWS